MDKWVGNLGISSAHHATCYELDVINLSSPLVYSKKELRALLGIMRQLVNFFFHACYLISQNATIKMFCIYIYIYIYIYRGGDEAD